jgi:hypothetical protein
MPGLGQTPFEVTCPSCRTRQRFSDALSIACAPALHYDPVLGPGTGLRFRASVFRWRSPSFLPVDPFGTPCDTLACCNPDCLQPVCVLQVGSRLGAPCLPVAKGESYVRPVLAEHRSVVVRVGLVDEDDASRKATVESYLAAAEDQIQLVAMLAEWSARGLYAEVESVLATSPTLVADVAAGVVPVQEAERIGRQMARLGISKPFPFVDGRQVEIALDAREKWANYRGVRSFTEAFRGSVLDRPWSGVLLARKAAARCVIELSGAFWAENFLELDRAAQMVLGRLLVHERLPLEKRAKCARELLRSEWTSPLSDKLRTQAEVVIWDARFERTRASLLTGDFDDFASNLVGWYRALDDADGKYEASSEAVEGRMSPLVSVAEQAEEFLRHRIRGVDGLRDLVSIAHSPNADRKARKFAAAEAEKLKAELSAGFGLSPGLEKIASEARQPWDDQRIRIGKAFAPVVVVIILIVSFVAWFLSGDGR